jgi:alpha-galactosidase
MTACMRRATRLAAILPFFVLLFAHPTAAASSIVAQNGDAIIAHDAAAGTWTLQAAGATLTVAADASRDFTIVGFVSSSNTSWTTGALPDSNIKVGGTTLAFGHRASGFQFQTTNVHDIGPMLQFDAAYELARASLRVIRHYRIVSGSPTFEAWTSYEAIGASEPAVADLSVLELTVANGALRWVSGLQGDNADVVIDSAFTIGRKELAAGEHFTIGAQKRSSEQDVPWLAIDGAKDEFYTALMWSGAWSLSATRTGGALKLSVGLVGMTTTVGGKAIDGPHVVFGAVPGGLAQATAALRSFVVDGLRDGRAFPSLVTYNTWFAYGTNIEDTTMRAEMDKASALGVELFVIDAGWYAGAGTSGLFDFDSGLGSWTPDPDRFPDGLKPLTDYAHSLGMKFGLWVEPERVNLALVGGSGADANWLATAGGAYQSESTAQICLASEKARAWLTDRLTELLDDVQPDYLKWDNNLFINCDRAGHGHGPTDGNFAHVGGLYALLSSVRERYPDMLVENVSGGGNRLDLGMLRYTDVAWMDDRTAPSVHVRHNLQGLSAVFPPSYLLSFVTNHEDESIYDSSDLSLYVRSRMEGALGLCFLSGEFSESDAAELSHEIEIYKSTRRTLSVAASTLLSSQASAEDGPSWDVLQQTAADGQEVLLYAVQSDDGVQKTNVKPTGLDADATYDVRSVDTGSLGSATGADLMTNGIDILQSPNTAAHILVITVK